MLLHQEFDAVVVAACPGREVHSLAVFARDGVARLYAGLSDGDQWCLCAARWTEALDAGAAPPVVLAATHERVLDVVSIDDLLRHEYRDR